MTGEIWQLLGINLAVMLVLLSLVAIPSFKSKDPSYIDGVWGLAFIAVAISSFVQTDGDDTRTLLLLGLTLLWGGRLSFYLLRRWARNGPDKRYQDMLGKKKKGGDTFFIWTRVFLTQAAILTVVSLPVQLGMVYSDDLTWWNYLGVGVALFGTAFESIGDYQLARFKASGVGHDKVMDQGLWRFSRHPNYFGESVVWWGMLLVCVSNVPTAFAFLGPLLITLFLLKWSGVGHNERTLKQSKPKYADYIASTSAFVPLPPRR